jgi:predicted nucleic acid-binding protein
VPLVIDANVAIAYAFDDERDAGVTSLVRRVADEGAIVPALWQVEVCNGLLVGRRRKRAGSVDFKHFLDVLAALPIRADDDPPTMTPLMRVAEETGLTAYDALYVELAERLRCELVTFDRQMASAARQRGIAVTVS